MVAMYLDEAQQRCVYGRQTESKLDEDCSPSHTSALGLYDEHNSENYAFYTPKESSVSGMPCQAMKWIF